MTLLLQDTLVISPSTVERIEGEISDVNDRVDLIEASSDCADVVGTKAELDSYDNFDYIIMNDFDSNLEIKVKEILEGMK